MTKRELLDSMTADDRSYIEAALWSSLYDEGYPLDRNGRDAKDFTAKALRTMLEEWRSFRDANREDIDATEDLRQPRDGYSYLDCAAHDFWLTRNWHGAGFWCRGYPMPLSDRLTAAAHAAGTRDLYVQRGKVGIE